MPREPKKNLIARKLQREIAAGIYPVGTLLPGEIEIAEREKVSRFTARAALGILVRLGLIVRRPHIGTRVISRGRPQGIGQRLGTFSDLSRLASGHQRKILSIEARVISRGDAARIHCLPGATLIRFTMIRLGEKAGDPPVAWTAEYVDPALKDLISEAPLHPDILMVDLIGMIYGMTCDEIRQSISATSLPEEPARALGATPGTPALRIYRRYLDRNGKAMLTTISYHPGDRYSFSLTIHADGRPVEAGKNFSAENLQKTKR
ncbi:MAG: GntR family transcriptional regulator [Sutterellaceae bacterium]|nr:GntR family transcriptional regulator [Sutterellaceae bacterium]MDD7442224.1 GntR family transcriptional regulator [Sutterellaceae bacterium]MDY2868088.1 GntR family transcriptional regulator [Mesosutterella sp.]